MHMKICGRWLALGLILATGLIGCDKDSGEKEEQKLKIYSWWTSAGETKALEALIDVFKAANPDVLVENATVTGGAGTAMTRLLDELKAGKIPDSYQRHVGEELKDDLTYLQDIDALYTEKGWASVMPATVINSATFDGKKYAVPVNVHRSNVIWYNKDLVTSPATQLDTWDHMIALLTSLGATGNKFALFGDWTAGHVFESILLAELGDAKYLQLFAGTLAWDSPEVKAALSKFNSLLAFCTTPTATDTDWSVYTLGQMTAASNKAAVTIMGDWFWGDLKVKAGSETAAVGQFGYAPSPGTANYFLYLADAFTYPKNGPQPELTKKWLDAVGSKAGQDAFNPIKGSIPARTDADQSKYDTYGKAAIADFAAKTLVPSLAHGAIGSPSFKGAYFYLIGEFVKATTRDVAATATLLKTCFATPSATGCAKP